MKGGCIMEKKVYPEWVHKHRRKGTTIKKVGDSYYLYKRTSKRVPGKKYPQPVDTYIGLITEEGIIESRRKKVSLTDVEVYEYGFSKAIWQLCPAGWKQPLGEDWEDILCMIIADWSANSYITKERMIKSEDDYHYQLAAQKAALLRRIYHECGMTMEEMRKLENIYLVCLDKGTAVSRISEEQAEIISRYRIDMEEY